MLRTSSYTIYVALPDNDTEMLLVHGYTGAYDRVSRPVAEYLRANESGPPPKPLYGDWELEPATWQPNGGAPAPAEQTLALLERRGYLTTMSVDEEEGHVARTAKKLHNRARLSMPNYMVMPTYDCSLRCGYCFQDHMRTKPEYRHPLRMMSTEMADRIIASMPAIEAQHGWESTDVPPRRIGFFGGEPLLAANRPIVEYIMNRCRALGQTQFWAVSNATQLEAYADLLGPTGIAQIQITLDGPPDEHDKRRIHADGSGSFEQIARNIDLCLDHRTTVTIRMNLDKLNIEHVPRLADGMVARGWDKRRGFGVYTSRIVPGNDSMSLSTVFGTTYDVDNALDELRKVHPSMQIIGRPDDGLESRARQIFDSQRHGISQFKSSFCGAHSGIYIYDAFGDIYACWERTGDDRIRIGRVLEDGQVEMHEANARLWHTRTPASNPTCRKCRYAFHCGGGCAVLAEKATGKFFKNYCDGFADRFRHSVAKAYTDYESGVAGAADVRVCDL